MNTISLALLLGLATQQPVEVRVGPRAIADPGFHTSPAAGCPEGRGYRVYETSTAVNGAWRMEVSISGAPQVSAGAFSPCTTGGARIRFATAHDASPSWTSGYLRPFDFGAGAIVEDPCVVRGTGDSDFLVVAKTANQIRSCTHDAATGATTPWTTLFTADPGVPVDKPWIVQGEPHEYYVTFFGNHFGAAPYYCLRSTDGGHTWPAPSPILVRGVPVVGGFCPQPAVQGSGPLYVMQRASQYRVLQWIDEGTSLDFAPLRSSATTELTFTIRASSGPSIPVPSSSTQGVLRAGTVPYLVADPSSEDRLYLVHHDFGDSASGTPGEDDDPSDMDVYVRRLVLIGGFWSNDATVRVPHRPAHDPSAAHPDAAIEGEHPDQFLPAAAVDRFGRIHVVYYDNRTSCGIAALGQRYDAWYALSVDHGASFTVHELRTCTQRPALDFDLVQTDDPDFSPREYVGIALDDSGADFTLVTVAYTGTVHGDASTIHASAIFSQLVRVRNP